MILDDSADGNGLETHTTAKEASNMPHYGLVGKIPTIDKDPLKQSSLRKTDHIEHFG
jgi:hypothetical protein